jgi:hypothetical protein
MYASSEPVAGEKNRGLPALSVGAVTRRSAEAGDDGHVWEGDPQYPPSERKGGGGLRLLSCWAGQPVTMIHWTITTPAAG